MVKPGQFLVSNEDGTIFLVSSSKEAREKAKGKAIAYALSVVFEIGYNKADQKPEPVTESVDDTTLESEPIKRKKKGK